VESTVSRPACSSVCSITVAGIYHCIQHHGQHVQQHTASWPACLKAHCITASMYEAPQGHASMYKNKECHDQHVQDCTTSIWLRNSSAFNLCVKVLIQIPVTNECHTSHNRDCPNITFHSIQNNHHLHTDINRHGEAHRCSITLSNACITLKLSSSCYSLVGFQL
jgi:hypothetical protein